MKLYIGEQLKTLRKEKRITQEALADVLGVSYQSVSRWELGVCYPDMELLPTIANYFGVSIDMLITKNTPVAGIPPTAGVLFLFFRQLLYLFPLSINAPGQKHAAVD